MLCPLLLGTAGVIAASLPPSASAPHQPPQTARLVRAAPATSGASLLAPSSDKNPYARLFEPGHERVGHPTVSERQPPSVVVKGEPKVVCGMTIFEADPAFDARIRVPVSNANVHYTIRRIPAPACR